LRGCPLTPAVQRAAAQKGVDRLRVAMEAIVVHEVVPVSVGLWGETTVIHVSMADLRRIECGIGRVEATRSSGGVVYRWVDPEGLEWTAVEVGTGEPGGVVASVPEEDADAWDQVLTAVEADLNRGDKELVDLRKWLDERPEMYALLVEESQIAGAWRVVDEGRSAERLRVQPEERDTVVASVYLSDNGDYWCADILGFDFDETWASEAEARSAVDDKFVDLGWSLLGCAP
ncbi:MAG: hypothetical protein ABMA64_42925, partial [Myxococcota bacterium]